MGEFDRLVFKPHRALAQAHLQTIAAHVLPSTRIRRSSTPWVIPLADGDKLTARYYEGRSKVLQILFHGLGGSADSNYMQIGGQAALDRGDHVLLVNHRGAGEGFDLARGLYHSGAVEDIQTVLRFARAQVPAKKICAIGFSLSANLLLNFVGRAAAEDHPAGVISVNPPIDLVATARCLVQPRNFVYDQKFVRDLKAIYRQKVLAGHWVRPKPLPLFCRLIDFDEAVTAPFAGFKSRQEYYEQCSSIRHTERLQAPTIIISAEDDPFIPGEILRNARYSSQVLLKLERFGGHVGFLSKPEKGRRSPGRWLSRALPAALDALAL